MITLNKEFFEQIVSQCKREYPNEACGIVGGTSTSLSVNGESCRTVQKVYEMVNAEKSPSFFSIDPAEQLKIIKDIRQAGLEMIGIYHSHVKSRAYPSHEDVQLAFYPEVSYLILSLNDMQNPVIKSFKINEGKITEEEIKIG